MALIIATFGSPEDITSPGFDGKAIRFPCAFVDAQYVGTPRQTSETKSGGITVEISDSLLATWNLNQSDLFKVLFQVAKEHLEASLGSYERLDQDMSVTVNNYTYQGACPFGPEFIEEPNGANVQIEVNRPIGFVWNA